MSYCMCCHNVGPVLPIAGCYICRPWHWPIVQINQYGTSRELRRPEGGWTNTPPDGWKDELMEKK